MNVFLVMLETGDGRYVAHAYIRSNRARNAIPRAIDLFSQNANTHKLIKGMSSKLK